MTAHKRFQLSACCPQPQKRVPPIPKASDIKVGGGWCEPPAAVASKLGRGSDWLIGIDIETHDWEISRGNKGSIGQFGFYNLCLPVDLEARVVQLGWAFGPAGAAATVKERLIRPVGFRVSEKAREYHKISHARAEDEGAPIADVLSEFIDDLLQVVKGEGGRLVCQHLEFDAGIIANELLRCGMKDAKAQFESIVRAGLCTMSPEIGRWLVQCWGEDCGSAKTTNALALKTIVHRLLPESASLLERQHSAGVDALLHRKVAYALRGLSVAPCRMPGGKHETRKVSPQGGPDVAECFICQERF